MVMLTTQKKQPVIGMSANTAKSGSSSTPVPQISNIGNAVNQIAGAAMGTTPVGIPSYTPTPPVNTAQKPMSASQASAKTPTVSVPPYQNAATSNTNPALGFGSVTYGSSAEANAAVRANQGLISTAEGRASEITRSQNVISEVTKALQADPNNADLQKRLADANKYLRVNLGYKPDQSTTYTEEKTVQTVPPLYGQLTPNQINGEADYRIEQERLARERALEKLRGALQNDFDYSGKLINDSRVHEDLAFQRNNSPFSGKTGYMETQLMRGRQIDDTARTRDFNNQLANAQQGLYDWESLAPEQRNSMVNELTRIERQYGLDVGSLTGYFGGVRTLAGQQLDYQKETDQRDYNYQVGRDQVADNQWQKQFDENKARYGEEVAYQKARDEIKDEQWKNQFDEDKRRYGLDYAIQQQQVRISQQNANTSSASAGNAASNASFSKLMDIWSATGVAPAGLEKYGISAGAAYKPESAKAVQNKIDGKASTDIYNDIYDDLSDPTITKDEARMLLSQNASSLTESDYKKLSDLINDRF